MRKFNSAVKDSAYLSYRWLSQVIDPFKLASGIPRFYGYVSDWSRYSQMMGAEPLRLMDTYPCLHDKTETTGFDSHYFYQDLWAFKRILASGCQQHVDVGSSIKLIGFLTAITQVTFVDIRPLTADLENLVSVSGSILEMPHENNSLLSLSCLHVAEHIGLGRYGDPLDPFGTKKAARELSRVLAPGGTLYFSLPVGQPRLCFNAHRIHAPQQILEYFHDLTLMELSGINDQGHFIENIDMDVLARCYYGCGLFRFTKA